MAAIKGKAILQVVAAHARPSPKLGQALGPLGVNMAEFCKQFNDRTAAYKPSVELRVKLTALEDRTFSFDIFPPATSWYLKRVAGLKKGSTAPGHQQVGSVSVKAIYEISKSKAEHDSTLKNHSLEAVCKMVAASARSIGLGLTR